MACNHPQEPIDKWLSLDTINEKGRMVHKMTPDEKHLGNPAIRAIHGGVVTLFLERVAELELIASESGPSKGAIINTNVDFLRSAKLKPTFGSAEIVRRGRRLAVINAKAWQDDPEKPVGQAIVNLKIG